MDGKFILKRITPGTDITQYYFVGLQNGDRPLDEWGIIEIDAQNKNLVLKRNISGLAIGPYKDADIITAGVAGIVIESNEKNHYPFCFEFDDSVKEDVDDSK